MRRTPPSSSHRRTTEGTTHKRVAALLGLIALGFMIGHVHPVGEPESDRFDTPVVSDDSAHHEHSSHAVVDTAACVACRSFGEKAIPASRQARLDTIDLHAGVLPEWTNASARAPFAGLPATRAPPVA